MHTTSTVHHTAASLIYRNTQKVGDFAAYTFWVTVPLIIIGVFVALFTYDTAAAEILGYIYASIVLVAILSICVMGICLKLLKKMRRF